MFLFSCALFCYLVFISSSSLPESCKQERLLLELVTFCLKLLALLIFFFPRSWMCVVSMQKEREKDIKLSVLNNLWFYVGCGEHLVRTLLARECSCALQNEDAHQALLETMQNKFISKYIISKLCSMCACWLWAHGYYISALRSLCCLLLVGETWSSVLHEGRHCSPSLPESL